MATERTLSILKPDTIEKNKAGEALAIIEATGLRPVAARMVHLTRKQAEGFYYVHRERKFFGELVDFMTRGPVLVLVLKGDNAIARYREVMGATNQPRLRKARSASASAPTSARTPATAPTRPRPPSSIGYFFPGSRSAEPPPTSARHRIFQGRWRSGETGVRLPPRHDRRPVPVGRAFGRPSHRAHRGGGRA